MFHLDNVEILSKSKFSVTDLLLAGIYKILINYETKNISDDLNNDEEKIIADLYSLSLLDYTHQECFNIIDRFCEKYHILRDEKIKINEDSSYVNESDREHEYDPRDVFPSKKKYEPFCVEHNKDIVPGEILFAEIEERM